MKDNQVDYAGVRAEALRYAAEHCLKRQCRGVVGVPLTEYQRGFSEGCKEMAADLNALADIATRKAMNETSRVAILEKAVTELSDTVMALCAEVKAAWARTEAAEARIATLEAALQEARFRTEAAEFQVTFLQEEISRLRASLDEEAHE